MLAINNWKHTPAQSEADCEKTLGPASGGPVNMHTVCTPMAAEKSLVNMLTCCQTFFICSRLDSWFVFVCFFLERSTKNSTTVSIIMKCKIISS